MLDVLNREPLVGVGIITVLLLQTVKEQDVYLGVSVMLILAE